MSLTSVIRYCRALDSAATDGSGKTAIAFGSFTASYLTQGGTLTSLTPETITTLGTYQAPSDAAHIRIKELAASDPTKGVYEIHFHNTQVAVAGQRLWLFLSATGAAIQPLELDLITTAALPSAAPGASGGLTIAGSNAATTFATLTSTGALTCGGASLGALTATTVTASGAVAFQSTFAVTGATTLTGAVSLGSTLGITGTLTLSNGLVVTPGICVSGSGISTGVNVATLYIAATAAQVDAVQCNGGNASGSSPAGHGLHFVGGKASTTAGGVAGHGVAGLGGQGAASTNGSGDGANLNGGSVTTVSGGHGLTLVHTGSGFDLNATTTPLALAKTTNITGFNDIAATAVVSSGAITTSGGAVSTVTSVTNGVTLAAGQHVIVDSGTVTTLSSLPSIPANWITAAGIADAAIDRATFAADTGMQAIRSSTATGATSTSLTLDAGASAANGFYVNCLLLLTGNTGGGQVRRVRTYTGSSKVAVVSPAWTTTPDTSTTFAVLPADSVWEDVMGDHVTSGTTGAALNAAGSAGDPWTTVLPGAYGAGTAGFLIGTNLDAAVTTRLAPTTLVPGAFGVGTAGYLLGTNLDVPVSTRLAPTVANRTLDVSTGGEAGLDWGNIGSPSATVSLTSTTLSAVTTTATATNVTTVNGIATNVITAASLATDASVKVAGAVWDLATVGHTTSGTFGAAMNAAGSAGDPWATSLPGAYGAGTAGFAVGTNLNATVGSRAVSATALSSAQWTNALATNLGTLAGHDPGVTLASHVDVTSLQTHGDSAWATATGFATPTNITAGTLTTVTNLTNAPTVGDFTAAMKTSLNAATPAVTVSDKTGFSLTGAYDFAKGTVAMSESYAANGVTPTPTQAIFALHQYLQSFAITGTSYTVKKLDNTIAFVVTLNDAATPTAATRS